MIRKLNIVMTYPVEWSLYAVMNNFIQNFYDAIGIENFLENFNYEFVEDRIILKSDVGFSKEWLFFMGTSSKREGDRTYAGKFGEGFKIAALIAYRDLGLKIRMESRDWVIEVIDVDDTIDNKDIKVLAYEITTRKYAENSILTLSNAKEEHFKEIKNQINHFYYEGNEHFGKTIVKNNKFAVYHANVKKGSYGYTGHLYVNYQHRGALWIPLVVCNHKYNISDDDRDRGWLTTAQENEIIRDVFYNLSPEQALEVLETCKSVWNDTFDRSYYKRNWVSMLRILIDIICDDKDCKDKFYNKYKDHLVCDDFLYFDKHKRKIAMEWYRNSDIYDTTRVVHYLFEKFGIDSIVDKCRADNGFEVTRDANSIEQEYINILQHIATKFFNNIFVYDNLPVCHIILNKKAPVLGLAYSVAEPRKIINVYGMRVKCHVENIYIQKEVLQENEFGRAVVVYMHELLHQFGGDSSRQFKKALMLMNDVIIHMSKELSLYEDEWRKVKQSEID